MTSQPNNNQPNMYLVSALGLIFMVATILFSWTTLPPAKRGLSSESMAVENVKTQPEVAGPAQPSAGDAGHGQALFTATCAACHGPTGQGIQGLGKNMTTSQFIAGLSDQALVDFIKAGRDPSDPLNTTGVAMPVKGGNPSLNDKDLLDIVAYIRSIHQ